VTSLARLRTDRARAAASAADIVMRLHYWSEDCRRRGLCAEGKVMFDAMNEIDMLRSIVPLHECDSMSGRR
jgi:hypothetical protein